ncbi:MAG: hypothetical protein ACR2JO_09670 [Mycobacteriales bacterium]
MCLRHGPGPAAPGRGGGDSVPLHPTGPPPPGLTDHPGSSPAPCCTTPTATTAPPAPALEHLGARTGLARRTLLAHLARLIDAGLLIRVTRGRHTSLVEQLHTGRHRNAAVYRLAHPLCPTTQQAHQRQAEEERRQAARDQA